MMAREIATGRAIEATMTAAVVVAMLGVET
jgi:hypothetical protein